MQHLGTETLIDYLHGGLAPGEDARVLAHLETCEACTRDLNGEAALTEHLRAAATAEELELPLGMKAAIMARIADAQRTSLLERAQSWLRPVVLVPLAAAAIAAAVFVPQALQTPSHALPVSYYLEEHAARAQENPLADRSAAVMMTSFDRTASVGSVPMIQAVTAASLADNDAR
jgi:anti-sigma factor RsiW